MPSLTLNPMVTLTGQEQVNQTYLSHPVPQMWVFMEVNMIAVKVNFKLAFYLSVPVKKHICCPPALGMHCVRRRGRVKQSGRRSPAASTTAAVADSIRIQDAFLNLLLLVDFFCPEKQLEVLIHQSLPQNESRGYNWSHDARAIFLLLTL